MLDHLSHISFQRIWWHFKTKTENPEMKLCHHFRKAELEGITHSFFAQNSFKSATKSKGVLRQAEVAQEVPGRLRARILLTFWHYKGGRSSAKRTGHLYPRRNPWYSLSEAESASGHTVLSGVPWKKIPSDTTGNPSRDRPTSSAAP